MLMKVPCSCKIPVNFGSFSFFWRIGRRAAERAWGWAWFTHGWCWKNVQERKGKRRSCGSEIIPEQTKDKLKSTTTWTFDSSWKRSSRNLPSGYPGYKWHEKVNPHNFKHSFPRTYTLKQQRIRKNKLMLIVCPFHLLTVQLCNACSRDMVAAKTAISEVSGASASSHVSESHRQGIHIMIRSLKKNSQRGEATLERLEEIVRSIPHSNDEVAAVWRIHPKVY